MLRKERVATRPGASGFAEHRRRLYQRHLLVFLIIGGGLFALDDFVLSPGLDWAHFLLFPWLIVFVVHTLALKSRGYSFAELLIPPRQPPVREVYETPLDYELVRSRQLRDGVNGAAAAIRDAHTAVAEGAVAAADELVSAVEEMVASVRSGRYRTDERAEKLVPEARAGLAELDRLHAELIRVEVEGGEPDPGPVEEVRQRAESIRRLAS
jgi:hypothetical protein